ncbi:extensin family protein, partial [Beijerinckia sp. L45]|uniref:extensin family protein n=1 Tax=Beijerinckia sp. L45 TaxID=1641855 RepID=UPI00131C74A4
PDTPAPVAPKEEPKISAPAPEPSKPAAPEGPPKASVPPEAPVKPPATPETPTLPVPPEAPTRPTPVVPAAPPAPSVAAPGPARQPAEDTGCLGRLKATSVVATPISIGAQPDARCTVVDAVKLSSLKLPDGAEVVFPDGPTLACVTADTFAAYVRELLSPLAKGSYGAPIAKVWTGPGLECRSRDHIAGAKLSAHGQGLAIDIAQMALTDGHVIAVGTPKTDADRAFETAARAAGCGYFHTTLGPGSDSYHKTHWHFDLEPRGSKGDGKFCQ